MTTLPCPFCGTAATVRADSCDPAKPFFVRCSDAGCLGYETCAGFSEPETAIAAWNRRATPVREPAAKIANVIGFTKRSLIRGELVALSLDAKGVFASDEIEFSPYSVPLMRKPVTQ